MLWIRFGIDAVVRRGKLSEATQAHFVRVTATQLCSPLRPREIRARAETPGKIQARD